MQKNAAVKGSSYRFSEKLSPYFATLFGIRICCPPDEAVFDVLYPVSTEFHFVKGLPPSAAIGKQPRQTTWPFVANGPTSRSIHFELGNCSIWGLAMYPLGWAKFMDVPARTVTDRFFDGSHTPPFQQFRPIQEIVEAEGRTSDEIAEWISDFLLEQLDEPPAQEKQILACQNALRDPDIATVMQLVERVDMSARSLERLCSRYFGFPPKFLLRRQRFLRSIGRFMLDSGQSWSEVLDPQYFDQAQFVREFRSFMDLTPREYADMEHPIMNLVLNQRLTDLGATQHPVSSATRMVRCN
ncbi:AraC family transcriptional regulator [Altericroceibacterium spongiae]|uniref:AraC family transcriptional regulator n=1 Tax=Altericroceibacterium spongiae TaxID=2320269 RepID=A0A420EJ20_9SPHN|nr:helix-turn-helix domain-containing protein [Altericroceibacterium spongiae]RKF20556.1 AraC family transcriptional regulator [Altericroceibacterium spongiae]